MKTRSLGEEINEYLDVIGKLLVVIGVMLLFWVVGSKWLDYRASLEVVVQDHANALPPMEGIIRHEGDVAKWSLINPDEVPERATYFNVSLEIYPDAEISVRDMLEGYCRNAPRCDFLCWTIGDHPERCISMEEAIRMLEEGPEPEEPTVINTLPPIQEEELIHHFDMEDVVEAAQFDLGSAVTFHGKDDGEVGSILWDDNDGDGKPNFRWEGTDIEESARLFIEHLTNCECVCGK